jgi:hypothetical protein
MNTSFGGKAYGPVNPAAAFRALMWVSSRAKSSPAQVLVFPENVLPDYSDAVTGDWLDLGMIARQGTTVLIGSDRTTASFERRENVLLVRGAFSAEYVQRIPIPVAMWGRNTEAHLFGCGSMQIGAHRAAVLLCYEQLLVGPSIDPMSCLPLRISTGRAKRMWMLWSRCVSKLGRAFSACLFCGRSIDEEITVARHHGSGIALDAAGATIVAR